MDKAFHKAKVRQILRRLKRKVYKERAGAVQRQESPESCEFTRERAKANINLCDWFVGFINEELKNLEAGK